MMTLRQPPAATATATENRLLASLPGKEYDRLAARLSTVAFGIRDLVYRAHGPIDHVYFPLNGVFSQIVVMQDGGAVEVGTVGHEGLLGLPLFFGDPVSPVQVFCQVPGHARRMSAADFRAEAGPGGPLHSLAQRYSLAQGVMMAQSVACNRLHSIDERCARWLLMTHDRVGADLFPMTQEFLAMMLGVRRASVTVAAGLLQRAGLIEYTRGRITVRDRPRLEAATCECYRTVKDELDRLVPPPDRTVSG